MKNYSDQHVEYLISGINNHYLRNGMSDSTRNNLILSLREGMHSEYVAIAAKDNFYLCGLCHIPTNMKGTLRCDACWELEQKLEPSRLSFWSNTSGGRTALNAAKERIEQVLK